MRLIYIANARIPTEKAHGYQIMKMCESFARRDFSVELIVPERKNKIKEAPFVFYDLKENFKIRKIKCFDFIGAFPKWGRVSFWLQNVFFNFYLFFAKLEKDAIFYTRSALAVLVLRLRNKEVFFESHSVAKNRKVGHKFLLGEKAKIIALTKEMKRIYCQLGFNQGNILVASDGVDLKIFVGEMKKEEARKKTDLPLDPSAGWAGKKIVGFFGRFRTMGEDKGLAGIIKTLVVLPKEVCLLAVGGSLAEIDFYKNLAVKDSVSDRVIFKTAVARTELPFYQQSCDILLMPFPDTEHYRFYMSPLKMFEYMASSRPIVATDLPSIREVLNEKNSVLIKSDNPNELAVAIKELVDNPVFGAALAKQARKDVENYTWEKRAEKISQFIKSK